MARTNLPAKTGSFWKHPFSLLGDFDDDLATFWNRPFFRAPMGYRGEWVPRMDAFEKDGKLVVTAELPGMERKDIHVHLDNGDLVLEGEHRESKKVEEKDYYRSERRFGTFYRRLPLAFDVEAGKINAHYENGILEVTLPMPKETKTKPIEVKVN